MRGRAGEVTAGVCAMALLAGALAGCGGRGAAPAARGHASAGPGHRRAEPAAGGGCPGATVTVSSAGALTRALAAARPGQVIVLAPGRYPGHFAAAASGTPAAPITVCGPRSAILDGGGIQRGYTFHLNRASWWTVRGFTVTGGQKGVVADGASHDIIDGLYVHAVGDEAIHLRAFSSHDVIKNCLVRDTGLLVPFYGEGIYVGSAHKNWCRYSGCRPDASDDNLITGNDIADTTAENIDIKEGTSGGMITGNRLDGTGMVGSAATAWVNVKGNDWTVADNTGITSIKDGFQVHRVYPGWGEDNVFRGNTLQVDGPGYGIYVQSRHLGTVVACDNRVSGAGRGLSNIACSPG
jgi:hypothetical protein